MYLLWQQPLQQEYGLTDYHVHIQRRKLYGGAPAEREQLARESGGAFRRIADRLRRVAALIGGVERVVQTVGEPANDGDEVIVAKDSDFIKGNF